MVKLVILGLDGATFRVIKPLCDEGRLPTFRRIMAQGAHGVLESTFPPMTSVAWPALATGKNPGRTGMFDSFLRVSKDSFQMRLMSSADVRRAKPYWDYLSSAGVSVGVVNYPFLYPPYKVNGVMVSGLGSAPEEDIYYPGDFKQRLLVRCDGYRIEVPWHEPQYHGNTALFVAELLELLDINECTLHLLLDEEFEVLTFVISASDFAQHYMWRYIDPTHPYYDEEQSRRYRPDFIRIWERIDGILASLLARLPADANILIASDHGFGPHRSAFFTNTWLEENGYFHKRAVLHRVTGLQHVAGKIVKALSTNLYNRINRSIVSGRLSKALLAPQIDLSRSLAFAPVNASLSGRIYVNGEMVASLRAGADAEAVRDEIADRLRETCRSLGVRANVYCPSELYSGEHVDLAPDILFEIDDFECSVHYAFNDRVYQNLPPHEVHSGLHKRDGIFMAYGPAIKAGVELQDARIYDVAPTVLHMLGMPVPDDMDGGVLQQVFKEGSEPAQRQVKYRKLEAERVEIRRRLKDLRGRRTL